MKNLLDSYTRCFNTRYKRKGPLREGRSKSILVQTEEQLLHLTRYIHLNPTSGALVNEPHEWQYSSYNEFLNESTDSICNFSKYLEIIPKSYRTFVEERKDYQRELALIKKSSF